MIVKTTKNNGNSNLTSQGNNGNGAAQPPASTNGIMTYSSPGHAEELPCDRVLGSTVRRKEPFYPKYTISGD